MHAECHPLADRFRLGSRTTFLYGHGTVLRDSDWLNQYTNSLIKHLTS
jgi:hypothetical protein